MEIRVVNYEMILERYQPYIDGIEKLESYKSDFTKKVESIKNEMEQIVSSSRVLVLDQSTKPLDDKDTMMKPSSPKKDLDPMDPKSWDEENFTEI